MWSTILIWIAVLVYTVLCLGTITIVLLENRQPAKTIAWTITIILLPVIGLLAFYFFGLNIRRSRYISTRQYQQLMWKMVNNVPRVSEDAVPQKYRNLAHLFETTNHSVVTTARSLEGFCTGMGWIQSLLRDIATATETIHLETYIIDDDPVGRLVRDALIDKAQEGVSVRLIYDAVGCWKVPRSFFQPLTEAGGKAIAFMPVQVPRFAHKINYRNHRKLCVIDGRIGYLGGMNIALRYVSRRMRPWRDVHMRAEGGCVADMQRLFLTDWCFTTGEKQLSYANLIPTDCGQGTPITPQTPMLQIVRSTPYAKYPEIMYGMTWVISHARKYVFVQTPYFMPPEPVLQALQTAAMSGVDVRIMVPDTPDSFWLRWANESYFTKMLQAGVRIFQYHGGFLHSKCCVADDDWCTVGSSNMDFRSYENNFESNAFIYNAWAASLVYNRFITDMEQSIEVKYSQWKNRSYYQRCLESYTRFFAPLL